MEVDSKLVQEIFVAGLLHEIGKVGFPDELLSTPVATMTPKHLDQFRKHPGLAEQLLMPLQDLKGPASIVAAQLERYDGTGYPERIREQAIPLGARVLTLASDYDNLQIGAFAQRQLSTDEAKALIQHGSGSRYDPAVVTAFLDVINGPAKDDPGKKAGVPVAAKDLAVGMVLTRDLMTPNGMLMLSAGHKLDERLITKIQDFERSSGVVQIAYIRQE
jgi:HD-GYP domain-containing protein (c-di-GMP phosphodiesterase class II)